MMQIAILSIAAAAAALIGYFVVSAIRRSHQRLRANALRFGLDNYELLADPKVGMITDFSLARALGKAGPDGDRFIEYLFNNRQSFGSPLGKYRCKKVVAYVEARPVVRWVDVTCFGISREHLERCLTAGK